MWRDPGRRRMIKGWVSLSSKEQLQSLASARTWSMAEVCLEVSFKVSLFCPGWTTLMRLVGTVKSAAANVEGGPGPLRR